MGQSMSYEDIDNERPVDLFHMDALVKSKKEGKDKDVFIVDVRDKFESDRYGSIPFSLHLPSGDLRHALQMSASDFQSKYKSHMPRKSDRIVFYDQRSGRAATAVEVAQTLGFKKVTYFSDGYEEWKKKLERVVDEDL